MSRFLTALILVCIACLSPVTGQDRIIQVNAQLSEQTISQEDVVILGIVISGNTTINKADIRLPSMPYFRFVNQSTRTNTQIINGQVTSALQYLYYLVPRQTGELEIPAMDVVFDGETYRTEPLTLQVTPGQNTSDIITRMVASHSSVYVGQQVQFRTELLFSSKVRVSRYDMSEEPRIEGFINIPDPTLTRQERSVVDLDETRYVKFTLSRNLLFPLSPGEKRIRGIPFEIQYYNDRFGNNIKFAERTTDDLVIEVKPLPEGAPEGFAGAVGKFRIDWSIDRTAGRAEEPFTLTVVVSGTGDVERIPQPHLNFGEHIEVIEVKNNANTSIRQGVWGGNRSWEYILVPGAEGEENLGPLEYVYFDPSSESYQTTETEPIVLTIAEAEKSNDGFVPQQFRPEAREVDIRFVKKHHTGMPADTLPSGLLIILLTGLPILVNLGALLIKLSLSGNGQVKRGNLKRKALKRALTQLSALPNAKREARQTELDRLSGIISEFFDNKFDIGASCGPSEIRNVLKRFDLHESEEMNTLAKIMAHCAAGKYAPSTLDKSSLTELLAKTREALQTLEEKI